MMRIIRFSVLMLICILALLQSTLAAERKDPQQWLEHFAKSWDETEWGPAGRRVGYMRSLDDRGWPARMLSMQALVAEGKKSIPALVKALQSTDRPTRILAAQTLGYLGADAPREALLEAAKNDADASVRLYAVDALGMRGGDVGKEMATLLSKEKNNDVRRHIAYARQRKGKAIDRSVVKTLLDWDPKTIDSATLGQPAPDFALSTLLGKTVQLSDYRGKKNVVLVFIYGDT